MLGRVATPHQLHTVAHYSAIHSPNGPSYGTDAASAAISSPTARSSASMSVPASRACNGSRCLAQSASARAHVLAEG